MTGSPSPSLAGRRLRVLVVDNSPVMGRLIAGGLSRDADLEVVGIAQDAYAARQLILERTPDVLTLDLEMPRLDGLTFLRALMAHHPMPVIVVSSLTPAGSEGAAAALRAGAVDVLAKTAGEGGVSRLMAQLVPRLHALRAAPPAQWRAADFQPAGRRRAPVRSPSGLIVIGASTGGTQVIEGLLSLMPLNTPPIAIVQHMPEAFTRGFAERLDQVTGLRVSEATSGARLLAGHGYVAPGGRHLLVEEDGPYLRARLSTGPRVHHQRPSVDVLFTAAARVRGWKRVGVLLTGMGADGADGLAALRASGATTIAQSEASCVVFGMPGAAVARQAAVHVRAWQEMPELICDALDDEAGCREVMPGRQPRSDSQSGSGGA